MTRNLGDQPLNTPSPKAYGPYDITVGSTPAGSEGTFSVTHNLNLGATQVIAGHLIDGANMSGVSWRAVANANSTTIVVRNNGGAAASGTFRFFIFTD